MQLSNVSCDSDQPWSDGLSLLNYINSVCVHRKYMCSLFYVHLWWVKRENIDNS